MSCPEHCPLGRRCPADDRTDRRSRMTAVSCGIDWAQDHHDVAVVDEQGAVVCAERISNDAAGLARLLEILTEHDPADARLEVAIETSRGLLVAGLRAAGRAVFAI